MERNKLVWLGLFVGSAIGGFVPTIWGASALSISSVVCSSLGAFTGIWLGWKLGQ